MATTKKPSKAKDPRFKAHTRYETINGDRVPGVTTVISGQLGWNKNMLIAWARREGLAGRDPDKIRDQAASVGQIAHYLIECHCKSVKPMLDNYSKNDIAEARVAFKAFRSWEKKSGIIEYVGNEIAIVSEKYKYGGTIDILARTPVGSALIDLKTSKGVYPDHELQVTAYSKAWEEVNHEKLVETIILRVDKATSGFEDHYLSKKYMALCWRVFRNLRSNYELQKLMKKG